MSKRRHSDHTEETYELIEAVEDFCVEQGLQTDAELVTLMLNVVMSRLLRQNDPAAALEIVKGKMDKCLLENAKGGNA